MGSVEEFLGEHQSEMVETNKGDLENKNKGKGKDQDQDFNRIN